MPIDPDLRFFFVHVPKTAGSTFREHVLANFPPEAIYPLDRGGGNEWRLQRLFELPEEQRARTRIYIGHFPYVATTVLGGDFVTLTVLRDPVERTLSYLRFHRQRHGTDDQSLEQVYDEDHLRFRRHIENMQTKMFAMSTSDRLGAYFNVIDIDGDRLEAAKRNLARVDVVGFQERFAEFLERVHHSYGWTFGPVRDVYVTPKADVPSSFRRRIADDNAMDMELYEFARSLDGARS